MLKNILSNLTKKYSTRLYPFSTRTAFTAARGKLWNDIDSCIFCNSCAKTCPSNAIVVDKETATWTYDPFSCVYCSVCVEKCPVKCLHMENEHRKPSPQKFLVTKHGQVKKKQTAQEKQPKQTIKDK